MSEPKKYEYVSDGFTARFINPKTGHAAPKGDYVRYEDYAQLEAEAERYRLASLRVDVGELHAQFNKALFDETLAENAGLKAVVERLSKPAIIGGYNISEYIRMANSETLEFDNGDMFADMTLPERIKYIVESHARLKAEVERLTKAGDAMGEEMLKLNHPHASIYLWCKAKEGNQP